MAMIDITTLYESAKRHWIAIVCVTIVCAVAGFAFSFVNARGEVDAGPTYTAEATIYVNGYESNAVEDYNYEYSDDKLISDVRRIIVSNEVAGKVREKYGEDVLISSPFWKDKETDNTLYTRFIFVDASAQDAQTALDAANMAAQLALELVREYVPVSIAEQTGQAELRVAGEDAADFGTDPLDPSEEVAGGLGGRINTKLVLILTVFGLFGSFFVLACYDILSRRMRTPHDVSRIIDVPVIGILDSSSACRGRIADDVSVLLSRSDLTKACVAGFSAGDGAPIVGEVLQDAGVDVSGVVDLSKDANAASVVSRADAVVLAIRSGASSAREIATGVERLKVANVPVLGAIFAPSTRKVR